MNKRKALEAAQKYVQKGQYDKALKEYQKHLQSDSEDTNARLKVGDLYLKLNNAQAAIEAYSQVAHQFSRSGFDAKAVAIYKQILKVDADCLDARIKLGEHFQRMGLGSEALRELQEAVNLCQKRGLKREAFDLLKRVADLDPDNLPNRLSLADLLVREGLRQEAEEEYGKLLERVEQEGAADQIVRVTEQMLASFPHSESALIAFATAKVKVGMAQDVIARLGDALPQFPDSIPVREALVAAYEAVGDANMKRKIYTEIAEIFRRRGDDDQARQILQCHVPVEGLNPSFDPDDEPLSIADIRSDGPIELDDLGGDGIPEPPPEPRRLSTRAEPESESAEDLIAQARVARDFSDDPDQARRLAERALQIDPNALSAREILLSVSPGADRIEDDDDPGTLPDIELVLVDDPDDDDSFSSVEPPLEVEMQLSEPAPEPFAAPPPDASPSGNGEEFEIDIDDLELDAVEHEQGRDLVDAPPPDDPLQPSSATWAQQSSYVVKTLDAAESIYAKGLLNEAKMLYEQVLQHAPNHPTAMVRLGEISEAQGADPEASASSLESSFEDTQIDKQEAPIELELDRPDSDDTFDDLLHPQGGKDEISSEPIEAVPVPQPEEDSFEVDDLLVTGDGKDVPELEFVEPEAGASALDDLDVDIDVDVPEGDDAFAVTSQPGLDDTLKQGQSASVEPPLVVEDDDIVVADESIAVQEESLDDLLEAFADEDEPEAEGDDDGFDLAAELESGPTPGAEPAFEDVFRAFKQGIEEQVSAEDASARYDLAIAYKEMGLIEDAVEALEKVRSAGPLGLEGVSLLATCKLEQGKADEAIGLFEGALGQVTGNDEGMALRYDLALAFLAAGRRDDALAAFQQVAEWDPDFREVQAQIADLSE